MITSMCFALVCFCQTPSKVFVDRVAIKVNDNILTQRKLQLIYNQRQNANTNACSGTELDEKLNEAIKAGNPFADVAKTFSEVPTKPKGGDLGPVQYDDLNPTLESGVKTMAVGEVSGILETDRAYSIVTLRERNPPEPKGLTSVRNEISYQLRKPRLSASLKKYIDPDTLRDSSVTRGLCQYQTLDSLKGR